MRARLRLAGLAVPLLVWTPILASGPASADVPDSCVHPAYDPIECARETRLEHLDVLPSARIRTLRRQRRSLEFRAPLQQEERNLLLEEIRDELRYRPKRR